MQHANVRVATRLFNQYVGNEAKEREFESKLRRYVAQHPNWNMAESAQTICDRVLSAPNYQPAGGDAAGSDVDANFSIRVQFQNEIRTALASDPTIQRLQQEAAARAADERSRRADGYDRENYGRSPLAGAPGTVEYVMQMTPGLSRQVASMVVRDIHTSRGDLDEASALQRAIQNTQDYGIFQDTQAHRDKKIRDAVKSVLPKPENWSHSEETQLVNAANRVLESRDNYTRGNGPRGNEKSGRH